MSKSLTSVTVNGDVESAHQQDVAVYDEDPAERDQREHLRQAWAGLDPVEQFVLEAMIVEEQDAGDVLDALRTLDVSIKAGVSATETNVQQLYYFKRKALSRLGLLIEQG